MNTENHDDAEQRLREMYLASQDVRAPDSLNRAVLDDAAAAVKPGVAKYLSAWGRPLAFAATLVLGIALLYDMQRIAPPLENELGNEPAIPLPTGRNAASEDNAPVPASRVLRKVREERQPTAELPPSAPPAEQPTDATNGELRQLNKFGDTQRAVRPPNEKAGRASDEATPSLAESRTVQDSLAAPATAARADRADSNSRDNGRQCQAVETQGAEQWWQCIVDLRDAGDDEVADQERELLHLSYPDFTVPE